jgi:hypothetical protein
MSWQLDHVFFATSEPDKVERELVELGVALTAHRTHIGQGTKSSSAMFENAYFELLWAHDRNELRSEVVRPLGLDERIRWRETGACPLGLCFRPDDLASAPATWPFATWQYKPAYAAVGDGIPIVTPPQHLSEPIIFVSTWPRPVGGHEHRGARRALTGVHLSRPGPGSTRSPALEWLVNCSPISLSDGSGYFLELEWDRGQKGEVYDLSSAPVRIRW